MADQTVGRIIGAATALFAQHGAEGVTVFDVASRCNISPGTVIYHFKSKDNLLFIVSRKALMDLYVMSRNEVNNSGTPLRRIHGIISAFFSLAHSSVDSVSFLARFDPFTRLAIKEFPCAELVVIRDQFIGLVEECVASGVADGLFNSVDSKVFALLIWGTLQGVCRLYSQGVPLEGLDLEIKNMATFRLTGAVCGKEGL